MPHDPIQGQVQGHEGQKFAKWSISKVIFYATLQVHVIKRPTVNYDTKF